MTNKIRASIWTAVLVFVAGCTQPNADKNPSSAATPQNPAVAPASPSALASNHVGSQFAGAQTVSLADLLANPDGFVGKVVQLKGNVSTMCVHKRGWFSIAGQDPRTSFVRVITGPNFLVPEGVVGKSATAEGTVQVQEVPEETARYFANSHGLGDPAAIKGPTKQVVLQATGAEFM